MDKRVGKVLKKPNPICIFCWKYLSLASSLTGDKIWHCENCDATFVKLKEEKAG
jgi:ribosomal protein L37AE/L43A